MSALLALTGVHAHYGHVEALKGIDLEVRAGEIVALIGANGAGKSTLLMTICGRPRASRGRIVFDGAALDDVPTHLIVRRGLAHVPEGRRVFARMTVYENLQMGATVADPRHFAGDLARVHALFPVLAQRATQRAGTLSGGEQQMLAIARALMARPRLLLLDEPSLGLAPLLIRQIFRVLAEINAQGTTILLVEQDAHHALKLAHRAYVLAAGRMVLAGTGPELLANPEVRAAYLEGGQPTPPG